MTGAVILLAQANAPPAMAEITDKNTVKCATLFIEHPPPSVQQPWLPIHLLDL